MKKQNVFEKLKELGFRLGSIDWYCQRFDLNDFRNREILMRSIPDSIIVINEKAELHLLQENLLLKGMRCLTPVETENHHFSRMVIWKYHG